MRSALTSFGIFDRMHSNRTSLVQFNTQTSVLGFKAHYSTNALKVHSLIGQLRDSAEYFNVGIAVATISSLGARWHNQAATLVNPQRLGVHSRELSGDRDHVDRGRALALGSAVVRLVTHVSLLRRLSLA
jgi:hypothetical protein